MRNGKDWKVDRKGRYGSGRPLYWAHAAGPTERRGSVRSGNTAFELVPLATARNPYDNVLMIDLATHPRLVDAERLQEMLPLGVHLTDVARRSMPALDDEHVRRRDVEGETFWTVLDTTTAFARYWGDEEPLDSSREALETQHRHLRALANGREEIRVNAFPISYQTVVDMTRHGLGTLGALTELDLQGVLMQTGLSQGEIATAYRTIQATLECREVETTTATASAHAA